MNSLSVLLAVYRKFRLAIWAHCIIMLAEGRVMSHVNLLMKSRKFYPLFWTQFLGAFNDNLLKNAWVVLLTFRSKPLLGLSANQMASVAAGTFVFPYLLFSSFAGQMADKYEKTRFIRWIKLAEIAIMLLAFLCFVLDRYDWLLFLLFLMGVHSAFFGPVKYSILPQHLSDDELVGGNALIEFGTFLGILLGTIAGGVLILKKGGAYAVGALLVFVAWVGWWFSRKIPVAEPVEPQLKLSWNLFRPMLQVYQLSIRKRSVFLSILGISWFWFFGGALLSLFPAYAKEVLSADESVVTLFLSIFSIGIGLGSVLCERLSRGGIELGLVPVGSLGVSIFIMDLFFVGTPQWSLGVGHLPLHAGQLIFHATGLRIIFDLGMMSIFSGFFIVPLYTLMQKRSEVFLRSRVIAANNIINAIFMVGSSVLIVYAAHLGVSIPQMFLGLAIVNVLISLFIYLVIPEFTLRFLIGIAANLMYRVKIEGRDLLPKEGPAIVVCNHVSFVDWMIIAASVKHPVRFVMDHSFGKNIFMKAVIKYGKIILIAPEKENPDLLKTSFEKISRELRANEIVCIFPEGALTRTGDMLTFRRGIEKIIAQDPVPVVPMALRGLWGSVFSRAKDPSKKATRGIWRPIELRVGPAIPAHEVSAATLFDSVSSLLGGRP